MIVEMPLHLPRHAFSTRDVARAGHIWRAFQEAALFGSTEMGWSPRRYRDEGIAFVVRQMDVLHHDEARYGEPVSARTWVSTFRRGIFSNRQIRLSGPRGLLASTTQQWVHVTDTLRPKRAAPELVEAFPLFEDGPDITVPAAATEVQGQERTFAFTSWHTLMDPLGHANHPAYVDWVEEALAVAVHTAGCDPVAVVPVAEQVRWRTGVLGGNQVVVRWRVTGLTEQDDVVLSADIEDPEGSPLATAVLVRRLVEGSLFDLLEG